MKLVKYMGIAFLAVGIVCLVAGVLVYGHSKAFIKRSVRTQGTVVDFAERRSSSSSSTRSSTLYYPIIRFQPETGEAVEFESNAGSSHPSYKKGDPIAVRYDPAEPDRACVDSFVSLWIGVIVTMPLAIVFGGAGAIMLAVAIRSAWREQWLQDFGRLITTQFQSVETNTAVRVNGKHPYVILSTWEDPATGRSHTFKSRSLWADPGPHIHSDTIDVRIDPNNPSRYRMDTSFLPDDAT